MKKLGWDKMAEEKVEVKTYDFLTNLPKSNKVPAWI